MERVTVQFSRQFHPYMAASKILELMDMLCGAWFSGRILPCIENGRLEPNPERMDEEDRAKFSGYMIRASEGVELSGSVVDIFGKKPAFVSFHSKVFAVTGGDKNIDTLEIAKELIASEYIGQLIFRKPGIPAEKCTFSLDKEGLLTVMFESAALKAIGPLLDKMREEKFEEAAAETMR